VSDERVAVEDIVQAAARGALRALDARKAGELGTGNTADLIRAGFTVQIVIRAGGGRLPEVLESELNPQPLPPG
jgi:hypothetical protein